MGKNSKQKNKVSLPAPPPTPAADTEADLRPPKRLAILGFAALGLLMGFLWGANSVIDVGQSTSPGRGWREQRWRRPPFPAPAPGGGPPWC